MPRLSYWNEQKTADYFWLDRVIREQFYVGGVGVICHKYLGPQDGQVENDPTQPQHQNEERQDETSIQDLLFLENRDRKYEKNLYSLRGVYNLSDNDFDLSQFGLLLTNDTLYMSFHMGEMVDILGRKLMNGDVFEMQHLVDEFPLDADKPHKPRFYEVQDGNQAGEGFAQTWRPHIWRVKIGPLADKQEVNQILGSAEEEDSLKNLFSTFSDEINIRDAVVLSAEQNDPHGGVPLIDHLANFIDESDPSFFDDNVGSGDVFPESPEVGDFFVRTDFTPHRLFRWGGNTWNRLYDRINERTWTNNLNAGSFINDRTQDEDSRGQYESKQALSKILLPRTS